MRIFAAAVLLCLLLVSSSSLAGSPGRQVDVPFLQDAVLEGRYEALERELGTLQQGFLQGAHSDRALGVAMAAFGSTNPRLEGALEGWLDAFPESAMALAAFGHYYSHLGWAARGGAFASETDGAQLERMLEYHRQAAEHLGAAIERDPELSVAYAEMIRLLKAYEPWQGLEQVLNAGTAQTPRTFAARLSYLVGLQPKWGGSMREMQRFLEDLKDAFPGDEDLDVLQGFLHYVIGDQLRMRNRDEDALDQYEQALAHGPHPMYHLGVAGALRRLGRDDAAIAEYDRALELYPYSVNGLSWRGWMYYREGDYQRARDDLDLAIRLDPLSPRALRFRARVLGRLDRHDEALADLRASLEFGDLNAWTHGRMGDIALQQKEDHEAAARSYSRATELAPGNIGYWYRYGVTLHAQRDCSVGPVLQRFTELCEAEADSRDCTTPRLDWAEHVVQFVETSKVCGN